MAGYLEAARRASAHVLVADLDSLELGDGDLRHLAGSLRLRDGEPVSSTDGRGGWRMCRFSGSGGGALIADGDIQRVTRRSPELCVAFAPVKGDRPEWAVQKLTELCVDRIVVMQTERSVVRWEGDRVASHLRRLTEVARQAVMQSRGLWMPAVEGVESFHAVASLKGAVLAEPCGGALSLSSPVVLIGPEGGWSEAELEAVQAGTVSLGEGVLRTETAAVTAGILLSALRAGVVAAR